MSATKAAPRDKSDSLVESVQYRVTETVHFINGSLVQPGAIVRLPKGVKPGPQLVAVNADGSPIRAEKAPKAE